MTNINAKFNDNDDGDDGNYDLWNNLTCEAIFASENPQTLSCLSVYLLEFFVGFGKPENNGESVNSIFSWEICQIKATSFYSWTDKNNFWGWMFFSINFWNSQRSTEFPPKKKQMNKAVGREVPV